MRRFKIGFANVSHKPWDDEVMDDTRNIFLCRYIFKSHEIFIHEFQCQNAHKKKNVCWLWLSSQSDHFDTTTLLLDDWYALFKHNRLLREPPSSSWLYVYYNNYVCSFDKQNVETHRAVEHSARASRKYNIYYFLFQLTEYGSRTITQCYLKSTWTFIVRGYGRNAQGTEDSVVNKLPEVIKQNVIWCSLAVTDLRVTHFVFLFFSLFGRFWSHSRSTLRKHTHTHIFRWCLVQPFTLHIHT